MQRQSLAVLAFAAAATLASTGAWAESPTVVHDTFVSAKSRAEVRAELDAYRQTGVNTYSIRYNPAANFRSTLSREQVVGAYLADRDAVAAVHSEDGGSAWFAQHQLRNDASAVLAGRPARAE